jgi:YD repeat-containing protein
MVQFMRRLAIILLLTVTVTVTVTVTTSLAAWADEQRYIYDPLGRLYQVIDQSGNTATYHYDAVGNLLAITRTTTQPAPVITGIIPSQARAGETVTVTITGSNLLGATLSATYAGLTISNVTAAPTQITATFALAETAAQGQATIQASTASGSASVAFTVLPPPQAPLLTPNYRYVEPGKTTTFTVGIAQADPYPTTIRLAVGDPGIATVAPSQVVIPAGQTAQSVTVTGLVLGTTTLTATAGTKTATATIDVTGPVTMVAAPVSVVLEDIQVTGPVFSRPVSVILEDVGTVGPVGNRAVSVVFEDIQVYNPAWAPPVSVKIGP